MTNDENDNLKLNQWAARFFGECYHEGVNEEYATVVCKHCGWRFGGGAWGSANKEYCSDLNLAAKLETAVIERAGEDRYWKALLNAVEWYELPVGMTLITADALTRVRACYAAVEGK